MKKNELYVLDTILQAVHQCTKKPEHYLSVQENIAQDLRKTIKDLYDLAFSKRLLLNTITQALPELIVEDFDAEQIWQQLEIENIEEFNRTGIENFTKALNSKNWNLPLRTYIPSTDTDNEKHENKQSESLEMCEYDCENEHTNLVEYSIEEKKKFKKLVNTKSKKRCTNNQVDDQFFKLDELNRFLKMKDEQSTCEGKQVNSEDEELELVDLFNDIPDSEDECGQDVDSRSSQLFKYADFFESPEIGDEQGDIFSHEDDDHPANTEQAFCQVQSSLEKRKSKLKKKIHQLEDQAVGDKPWQLKGEVSSKDRPKNSLLEEYVEFDQVTRPAPVMTEQTTMKLEDIIRNRIKDKAWDDVVEKVKPVETCMEYKKKLIMNQEKSKESLTQIYENEYIKHRQELAADDKEEQQQLEEPQEHFKIRELVHSLFIKLDALSNFHYTPKLAKPEIKIVSNVPAINMEEVAPLATSDGALLAPEEIQSKQKGDLIGKSERTKTDMKRARRKKKLRQQARALNKCKKSVRNLKQKISLSSDETRKLKGRNVRDMHDIASGKTIKSSTAFFSQLQDQVVATSVNLKIITTAKKPKNTLSAVKLKL